MQTARPLEVLFLTNFSNSSYRAIPALAQLADELDIRLTILHAAEPGRRESADANNRLASFFPEADAYGTTRRTVFPGQVIDAVKCVADIHPVDLIVAPSSDPLGVPRLLHSSLRSRMIRECGAPVWTMGRSIHTAVLNQRMKKIGCWVDLASKNTSHIALAFECAAKLGAAIHLLHALPEIDEGSLTLPLHYDKPLHQSGAIEEIRTLLGWTPIKPEIHIATGSHRSLMPKMAQELQLDILFAGKEQAIRQGLTATSISAAVDRCPCPVICCDSNKTPVWQLKRGPAFDVPAITTKAA